MENVYYVNGEKREFGNGYGWEISSEDWNDMSQDEREKALVLQMQGYSLNEFQLFLDEYGWQDWMNNYTEAAQDEPCTETELETINGILKEVFMKRIMKRYKYLPEHEDFNMISQHYCPERLDDFEQAIETYVKSGKTELAFLAESEYGYGDIINWYDGNISTDDLFEVLEE